MEDQRPSRPRARGRGAARGQGDLFNPQPVRQQQQELLAQEQAAASGSFQTFARPGPPAVIPSQSAVQIAEAVRSRGRARSASTSRTEAEAIGSLRLSEAPFGSYAPPEISRGTHRRKAVEEAVKTCPIAPKSKLGVSGEKVNLTANFYELLKTPEWSLYQYRVDFEPDEDRTSAKKGMIRIHKDTLGAYMFDGTTLYTVTRLPKDTEPIELFSVRKLPDGEFPVRIIIKFTNQLMVGDIQYLTFFNIVLRKCIEGLDLQLVGRDYYDASAKININQFNFEIWPGIFTAIKQHERNVLMNIDISSKIMRRETALHVLHDCRKNSHDWEELFRTRILGANIITLYNNKTYRVDDVDFSTTPKSTFKKGEADISFIEYYKQRYNINIKDTNQPLLISKPKERDIRGGRSNNILLIPELANMTGLTDEMRSNFHLMKTLGDHTRIKPHARMAKYHDFITKMKNTEKAKEELMLWNLDIAPKPVQFTGRIIENEEVKFGNNKSVKTDSCADWTRSLRGNSMLYHNTLSPWAIIYVKRYANDVKSFVRTLATASNSLNYPISNPEIWKELNDDRVATYVNAIEDVINTNSPKFIMCIVSNNKSDSYSAIKKKCYVDRAIPNQVVLSKNLMSKGVMSIATKIAIQMNCKIGGAPWTVNVPFKVPAMIVGFDIYHDSKSKQRSYGAMVASINATYSRYYSAVSAHTNGEELSNDLSINICKAILKFKSVNHNQLPSHIILYRDGVGDGNLTYVYTHEVELIRKRLNEIYEGAEPKLVVVVVSKRINTRLFLEGKNPPPGTIADDVITVPDKYDFFLVSQSVNQGTVTPTSYNVIYDNSGLSPDIMQRLTYKMTHLYYNWSGTLRVPAQCQYAHKLAYMVGQYLHSEPNQAMNDLLYFL